MYLLTLPDGNGRQIKLGEMIGNSPFRVWIAALFREKYGSDYDFDNAADRLPCIVNAQDLKRLMDDAIAGRLTSTASTLEMMDNEAMHERVFEALEVALPRARGGEEFEIFAIREYRFASR